MLSPKEGEKPRRVSYEEVETIARHFGVDAPTAGELRYAEQAGAVPVRGRISERVWVADLAGKVDREIGAVMHRSYPLSDQSAYQIDAAGLPGEVYEPGDYLITVPFSSYRARPLVKDLIVVKREKDGLVSYGLRRANEEKGHIVLEPVLEGADPSSDGELFALVIGFHRSYV